MTSDLKARRSTKSSEPETRMRVLCPRPDDPSRERASKGAVSFKLRRRQTLPAVREPDEAIYLLRSGIVLACASPAGLRRSVLAILYPGDIMAASGLPAGMDAALVAAIPAELCRMRASALDPGLESQELTLSKVREILSRQMARQSLHLAAVGSLNGAQRVATCLLELAQRTGVPAGRGVSFEMPLTRADMADYLALNADTLSRIMSRLRETGVIGQTARSRLVCRDLELLKKATPLAASVLALHPAAAR